MHPLCEEERGLTSLEVLERNTVEAIPASDDVFSRYKVELNMALKRISSPCNESLGRRRPSG